MQILPMANQVFFRAVTPGSPDAGTKLDTAYVEFSNGPTVPPEEIDPSTLRVYFDSLASTGTRDYLRIPILSHTLKTLPDGTYQLTVMVATDGTAGVHGKPFSSAVGSRVYAVTLAASQLNVMDDIFMARHHYPVMEQLEKPENGSLMIRGSLI